MPVCVCVFSGRWGEVSQIKWVLNVRVKKVRLSLGGSERAKWEQIGDLARVQVRSSEGRGEARCWGCRGGLEGKIKVSRKGLSKLGEANSRALAAELTIQDQPPFQRLGH